MEFVRNTDAGQGRLTSVATRLPEIGPDPRLDVGLSLCPGCYSITHLRNPLGGVVLALLTGQFHHPDAHVRAQRLPR